MTAVVIIGGGPGGYEAALVARQLFLQAAGFGQVGEQDQLPRLVFQAADGNRQTPAVPQRDLVAVVGTRREGTLDDITPALVQQRLAQQLLGHRIDLADHTLTVDDPDATGQKVEHLAQAPRQTLLLGQLLQALLAGHDQLARQLGDPLLEQLPRGIQLPGQAREQRLRGGSRRGRSKGNGVVGHGDFHTASVGKPTRCRCGSKGRAGRPKGPP